MNILKSKHIKSFREKLLKEQNYIDPITNEVITNPTLDHDHVTGHIRMVLDRNVNQFEGRIINYYNRLIKYKNLPITLPNILRNLALYLEKDFSNTPYHPDHLLLITRKFRGFRKEEQEAILKEANIIPSTNSKLRSKQFKKLIQNEN